MADSHIKYLFSAHLVYATVNHDSHAGRLRDAEIDVESAYVLVQGSVVVWFKAFGLDELIYE